MLLGITFAWFTDTVTSSGNVIQAGDLDIELYQHTSATEKVKISDSNKPIFGAINSTSANNDTADTLWEPGKTQTVYFSIVNGGSLDLKYMVAIEVTNVTNDLNKVLSYIITPDAEFGEVTKNDLDWTKGSRVNSGVNYTTNGDVNLVVDATHHFALSVHMDELAGNDYQGANTVYYTVKGASDVPNFTVASAAGTKTFNITVNGLVEGNTEPVKAKVRIDKGLNETLGITDDQEVKVTVYHHKADGTVEEISAVYSNESGLVEFVTTSFSPFTIAWEVVNGIPADIPVADVRYAE